jgi:hypothetical protein
MILSIQAIWQNALFGDYRINIRFGKILRTLSLQIKHSIPLTFREWRDIKGVYRFLNNKKVTDKAILESQASTVSIEPFTTYLAIHDTTEINLTGHRGADNLGCLSYENKKGFYVHNTLLTDQAGIPTCIFNQHYWNRIPESLSKKKARKFLPIEQKESYRWIESVEKVNNYFTAYPKSTLINICDREGDIYELLSMEYPSNSHYIIRSCNNRRTQEEEKIWDRVKAQSTLFSYEIVVFDRQTLKKRIAHLEVKWLPKVELLPTYRKGDKVKAVSVNIIYVQEKNAPQGIKPIDWKLLTSLPLELDSELNQAIVYYSYRWRIETFHYILKQGCCVEELQLEKEQSLKNAIALYSVISCRTLAMMFLSRENPKTPLQKIGVTTEEYFFLFTYLKGNYSIKFSPDIKEPTVGNFTELIGMLGGHLKHNSKYPGIKILWRGMMEFNTLLKCFRILSSERCG